MYKMKICSFVFFFLLSIPFLLASFSFLGIALWSEYDHKLNLPPQKNFIISILKGVVDGADGGNKNYRKIMDYIQRNFMCCGYKGPSDYNLRSPDGLKSCVSSENKHALEKFMKYFLFQVGCGEAIAQDIKNRFGFIIVYAIIQFLIGLMLLLLATRSFCFTQSYNKIPTQDK